MFQLKSSCLGLILLFVVSHHCFGQSFIKKPSFFKSELKESLESQIIFALDSLYSDMNDYNLSDNQLSIKTSELTKAVLNRYLLSPLKRKKTNFTQYSNQLSNLYPLNDGRFMVSVAHIHKTSLELEYKIELLGQLENGKIKFSSPLYYYASNWKTQKVGNINYHYRDTIQVARAHVFDEKNTSIATKLGLNPDEFDFFMCHNEQKVLKFLGIQLMARRSGSTRNGFGVYSRVICSIMNHEDFSHDVFHYYSGKVNEDENRNWITEEGVAYAWGNAYYTDGEGEMISLERLALELKQYLEKNPKVDVFDLFIKNTKIFKHIAPEISVRSTISGVFVKEVEERMGIKGVLQLINCGSKNSMEKYLATINQLLGINRENFNDELFKLIVKNEKL